MATSAFRSTTRRGYQIGRSESTTESSGVPSTPRSRRDPSPSPNGRGLHRRSSSFTDYSARYFSDCSSEVRSSYYGSRTAQSSVCPSDSESDMESLYTHWRPRKWGAESEDERPTVPSVSTSVTKSERKGLRRTSSSQDFSHNRSKMSHQKPILDKNSAVDDREALAEEKTIRAVYAQIKSLGSDPPVGDIGMRDFLDAMRMEVRRAVSEIRMELEQAIQKNGKLASIVFAQSSSESQSTDVIQAVANIGKEYKAKLKESEKRVRELWSQIAVEERRCLELSKIVKELLPLPPPVSTSTAANSSSRRRSSRRKNSAERQLDLKSLDDEALKYLEECVSISSFDCQGESDDSVQEKGGSNRPWIGQAPPQKNDCERGTQQHLNSSMGSDGVVLPWLQWEAEGSGNGEMTSKQEINLARRMNDGTVTQFQNSDGTPSSSTAKKPAAVNMAAKQTLQSTRGEACEATGNVLESKQKAYLSGLSFFTVEDRNLVVQSGGLLADVDTLLLEKIKFRCRVENGELLLCRGSFLM